MNARVEASLRRRVLSSSLWSVVGFGSGYVIRLVSNLLITRLLAPEMFGVMAIASMILFALGMFSDLGLKPSIIRSNRGTEPLFLNTAWVIQILRGLLLWALALVAGIVIYLLNQFGLFSRGSVYSDPSLPIAVAAISFSVAISGFSSTKLLEASRQLALSRVAQIQVVAQLLSVICMLVWSMVDRSIWVLIVGNLCASVVATLLSHIWLPGARNRWQWDQRAFDEIVHFGKWIFLSSILGFLASSGDRLLLSSFVDERTLGIYSIAFLIYGSFEQAIAKIIIEISFPALSEVARDRSKDLKSTYYKFRLYISWAAYASSGILIVSADAIIGFLYDQRYQDAGWMLQLLSVGLIAVPFQVAQDIFLTLRSSRVFTFLISIRVFALFLFCSLGYHFWGISGALVGIAASYFASLPFILYLKIKSKIFDAAKEIANLVALPIGAAAGEILKFSILLAKPWLHLH